jgi:hypothetical protein
MISSTLTSFQCETDDHGEVIDISPIKSQRDSCATVDEDGNIVLLQRFAPSTDRRDENGCRRALFLRRRHRRFLP